jgi:hypothetical protein
MNDRGVSSIRPFENGRIVPGKNDDCFVVEDFPNSPVGDQQTFCITSNPEIQRRAPVEIRKSVDNRKQVNIFFCAPQSESFIQRILGIVKSLFD